MRSLSGKSFWRFFVFTAMILLCCFPLLYVLMERKYAERLGEFLELRTRAFIAGDLPHLTPADIGQWNTFNEDMLILSPDVMEGVTLGRVYDREYFSRVKGRSILYLDLCTGISVGGEPWIFRARVPMIEPRDVLHTLLTQYGVIFVVLAAGLPLVFFWISKRLWRPFYDTLGKIERFSLEAGREPRFERTDIEEFSRLDERLKILIRENLGVYRRQKEFVENASHELQTPLAVFRSGLDTLLQQPGLTARQTEIIQSLYITSSRMARLNKNLLLLARMDNAQFEARQTMDLTGVLHRQLDPLRELAASNGISVSIGGVKEVFPVEANETLLESLVTNLIVNAIRHNTPGGGTIDIETGTGRLTIANTGAPEALDPERIFRRFSRGTTERAGNGLGLSIVHRICALHGWRVEYAFADGRHTFTVSFSTPTN